MYEKLSLNSYLNVCVDVGQINRAFNTLLKLSNFRKSQLVDVNHYNIVLKGWAKLASIAQVVETRMHMIRNNIEPNTESYAYILLAYAKGTDNRKSTIKRIYFDLKNRNIDPETLFHHAYISPNDRKSIVNLLKQIDPKYQDRFCPEPINYDCKLLKGFDKTPYVPYDFSGIKDMKKLESWADNQRSIENKSSIFIKSVANIKDSPQQLERYSKLWQRLTEIWKKTLHEALDDSFATLQKQSEDSSKIHLYPYLCSIDKTMLVHLMLDEIETNASFASYSMSTNQLHKNFGHKIMTRYLRAKSIEDGSYHEKQKIYTEYLREYCTNPDLVSRVTPRQFIQTKAVETNNYSIYKDKLTLVEEWPHHIVMAVGKFLYGVLLREIKFDPETVRNPKRDINMNNLVHAFYTAYFQIDSSHKIKEEFRAHQDFERLQLKASAVRLKFDYSYLPCSSPPLPWLSRHFGGYLTNKSELVRVSNPFAEQTHVTSQTNQNQKLYPSLDSLNAIGICPWIVNKDILDLVIHLFQSGGDTDLNVPLDESKMNDKLPVLKDNPSKADKILYNKEKKRHDQRRREMYSLWRDCLYRLSIANHFRDKIFWFPHNMDFRGRTYPIPPHFNHLGADLARALLLFAKGRPLGHRGLDWIKIHMINLVGNMKSNSLKERLEYANSILHLEVLDSADNPWDGRRWWTNNENPWQVLACCKEIARAIRSGDPTQYISHFPVHQDGSCNGLQHYAALGRDPGGAMAVNLIPCDRPQDVYSRVVDIVESMRKQDAEKGLKVAVMLDGFIQRKVIKQTVMTTVYGVTRYGARQQIARQLTAKGYNERDVWMAAQYLTTKTFESIGQMFNKSRLIQDWLNDCAYIIASKCRQPVSWETPLGFLVTQPYTLPSMTSTNRLLSSTVSGDTLVSNDPLSRLNAPKQKTAFPPNYIHSLDSSHMMLTSLHCQRRGITFVSVHDCYWTHPSTVDEMNEICRQQFIALHSEPLLHDLSEQFLTRFGEYFEQKEAAFIKKVACGNKATKPLIEIYDSSTQTDHGKTRAKFLDVPTTGDLNLQLVQNSTYFFS
jgi:DNA-directed RNA polymerase